MKTKLLKSMRVLLVAAGLCVGVNGAWGLDVAPTLVTSVSYNSADTPLYDADATSWVTNHGNFGGAGNNKANTAMAFIKFDVSSELNGKLIRSAQLCFHSVCNDAGYNSTVYAAVMSTNWNETATWNNSNSSSVLSPRTGVGSFNVNSNGADLTYDVTNVLRAEADDDNVIAFLIYTGTARSQTISNIKLVLDLADASTHAYYTVKYVDEDGTAVKSSIQRVGANNDPIILLDSDKETFFTSGNAKKYTYVSDNSSSKTVASDGTTEVTVVFHDNLYCNYTIQTSLGVILAEGADWEGTVLNYAYPRYYNVDGTLYEAAANGNAYTNSITLSSDGQTQTVTYSATSITNVYFYSEAEDLVTSSYQVKVGTLSTTGSGGMGAASSGNNLTATPITVTTLPAGKYKVIARLGGKKNGGHQVKAGETVILNVSSTVGEENNLTNGYLAEKISSDFTLDEETTITYSGGYVTTTAGNAQGLDYIYFTKSAVAYTVEYKCGATELKAADVSRTAPWGTTVTITDADKENIFYSEGHATYEYASDNASSTTIASDGSSVITVEFTQVPLYTQTNVTDAETWDWSVITSGSTQMTDATTPKKNEYFVLKNLELLEGYSIPAGFGDAQKLNVRGEYGFRIVSGTKFFQGANIKFTTEVPGTLEVQFSNTGNNTERHLTVNGVEKGDGTSSADKVTASGIPVAAGDVVLGASTNYLRFYKIVFTPNLEVANAIADCKAYETSAAFATYIDGNAFATAAEVYAAHSAWQIARAQANGSTDYSKAIMNRTFELHNTNGWTIYGDASNASNDNDKYGVVEYGEGWSQYYTGWNGRNVSQNIACLPAGTYRLTAKVYSWSGGASVRLFANGQLSDAENGEDHDPVLDFTVAGNETNIKIGIGGVGNNNDTDNTWGTWGYRVKNFTLTKLSVSGSIASSGYSSLGAAYGLDFANATGLTAAYAVTNITKDAVTLTSVDELPANSGVILKGEANAAYNIPVKADASYNGTNKLYAAVEAYGCAANEVYILQGGLFHLVTSASTVPAGKAYLLASDVPAEARSLGFLFDDDAQGISAVSRDLQNGEFYNLQGQRVDAPKKGLYIVNGTKVIVK